MRFAEKLVRIVARIVRKRKPCTGNSANVCAARCRSFSKQASEFSSPLTTRVFSALRRRLFRLPPRTSTPSLRKCPREERTKHPTTKASNGHAWARQLRVCIPVERFAFPWAVAIEIQTPSMVRDYFNPELRKVMAVNRRLRQITVKFEVREGDVPAL